MVSTTLCKRGRGLLRMGPTPEHPTPASQSTQDSYVSKGGPLRGMGVLLAARPLVEHRGWKRKRSMDYLGYGRGYLLVRG